MDNCLNILHFPDEILLLILNELDTVDILYSLVDVNQRLDRLALDPLTICNINMTMKRFQSISDQPFSLPKQILSKISDRMKKSIVCSFHRKK